MSIDFEKIRREVSKQRRQFPETIGTTNLYGFDLSIIPPWCDWEDDEVLKVTLKSAAVCCICPQGILMVHVIDNKKPSWDIPAGGRKGIDKSPAETAIRELYEETGILVEEKDLELFGYAFKKRQKGNVGGLQYLCCMNIPIPEDAEMDGDGRFFFPPFKGTHLNEIDRLVVEPLDVFMSQNTLLNSSHAWAYERMQGSLLTRFERMGEVAV